MSKRARYKYLIYDARYNFEPERAWVHDICDSLGEAKRVREQTYSSDSVIVECRVKGKELIETGETW